MEVRYDGNFSIFISVHQLCPIPIPEPPYSDWSVHHITKSDATGEDEVQTLEEAGIPWRSRYNGRWRDNCMRQNKMKSMHQVSTTVYIELKCHVVVLFLEISTPASGMESLAVQVYLPA